MNRRIKRKQQWEMVDNDEDGLKALNNPFPYELYHTIYFLINAPSVCIMKIAKVFQIFI